MNELAVLRTKMLWSQCQMAEFLGCTQPTVNRIENGQPVSGPAARMISRLHFLVATGLAVPGMSVADVLGFAIGQSLTDDEPTSIRESA